jgi:hypothetical protein
VVTSLKALKKNKNRLWLGDAGLFIACPIDYFKRLLADLSSRLPLVLFNLVVHHHPKNLPDIPALFSHPIARVC